MNIPADTLSEQLCAFMDGELPEAEARFLQRRLEHDDELRQKWARLQLASACIKGHPLRMMSDSVFAGVSGGISATTHGKVSRPIHHWALAASVAALALLFAPRLMQQASSPQAVAVATVAAVSATSVPDHVLASPASADLVAVRRPEAVNPVRAAAAPAPTRVPGPELIASNSVATTQSSPMPLSELSPADFPLLDRGEKRSWPRSELIGGQNEPALEAYLVRHNQMLANDGLGGFVPYVDVVASDPSATPSDADPQATEAGANQQ
jgi:negative regulator of sigma E activity